MVTHGDADFLYRFCAEHQPAAVNMEMLQQSGWDQTRAMKAANQLLRQRRIKILPGPVKGTVCFEYVPPELAKKFEGLDINAIKIYSFIEKKDNQGAWTRQMKTELGLQENAIKGICKNLVWRKLIKEVKTIKNTKTYMLIDVDPAREISGGSFYAEGCMDKEWIEELRECCREVLNKRGRAVKLEEFHDHMLHKGIQGGKKQPTKEEVETVLRTLVLDGEFLMQTHDGEKSYSLHGKGGSNGFDFFGGRFPRYVSKGLEIVSSRFAIPCLSCPLADECRIGSRVSPEKCEFFDRWLGDIQSQTDARPFAQSSMVGTDISW